MVSLTSNKTEPPVGTKAVKNWLRTENITLLEPWPGNSPDLNIIENVWVTMKKLVAAHIPTSEADVTKWIKHVWVQQITPDYCRKLCDSMLGKIATVLKNKGMHCKY